jgi:hypothetical protein
MWARGALYRGEYISMQGDEATHSQKMAERAIANIN